MEKLISLIAICTLLHGSVNAQNADYRTTEDGLTQLMNNIDFLDRMSKMSNQDLLNMNVQNLINEYVPEYRDFKMELDKLDLNKVYYGGGSGYNTQQLANGLGKMLGMNEQETNNLNGVLSGQYNFTDVRQAGNIISNQLCQKGKHEGVDYVTDNLNGALQKEFGDGGNASALIDIGTGLLGSLLFDLSEDNSAADAQKEKEAKEAQAKFDAYLKTQTELISKAGEAKIYSMKQEQAHNYLEAAKGYTEAMNCYKQMDDYGAYPIIECYTHRGRLKMEGKDYRGAIVDFYLGLNLFEAAGKGKVDLGNHIILDKEEAVYGLIRGRAYAKYKLQDFNAALSDCNLVLSALKKFDPKKADWKNGAAKYDPYSFMPQNTLVNDLLGIMGLCYIGQGKYAEAIEVLKFNKSIITMQNFAVSNDELPRTFHREVMLAKTIGYFKTGNYTESLKEYDKYIDCKQWIQMQGGNVSAGYSGRGNVHMAMGKYKAALEDYNKAIDLEPGEASYYLNRANCKLLLGDKEGAKQDAGFFKNPASANAQKKSLAYYWTKYSAIPDKLNDRACLQLLDTMAAEYPGDESVLGIIVHHVNHANNAELANTYKQKYAANTSYGPAFKAMFLLAINNTADAYTAIIDGLNNGLSLQTATLIHPSLTTQSDYCSLLSKYQRNFSKAMANNSEAAKMMNENINSKLKIVDVDPTASFSLAIQYLNIGDGENALKYLEKYLSANEYNLNIISVEYKINTLFLLGRTQEAVEVARAYYMKEKDGYSKDLPQMKMVANIAANHCGFSTLPPPQEPKETGKKKK